MKTIEPSSHHLRTELTTHLAYRSKLIEAIPGIDDATLQDTLEGLTDINEMIAELLRSALIDEALCDGLKVRIQEMRDRQDRLDQRAEKKRTLAKEVMEAGGIDKIKDPEFTASLRKAPASLAINDEAQIPEWFWIPQPPRLDRQGILSILKGGGDVAGADLIEDRVSLSVRTR